MRVGPACYNPAPVRKISVNGILNPFQSLRLVARQAESRTNATAETFLGNEPFSTGWRMFSMDPLQEQTYIVLDLRPLGTVLFQDGEAIPPVPEINGGFRYTFAGARVEWTEIGGIIQCFEVDIGAGTVFTVPPTNQVSVDLLLPDPEGVDLIPVPDNFALNQRFASTVSCKATCVSSPSRGFPAIQKYVYVDGGEPFGVIGQQVPIPRGASTLQVFSSPAPGNAAPIDEPQNTTVVFAVEPVPLAPGVAPPPPFDTWPSQLIPFSTAAQTLQTERVRIAPEFNVVRVRARPINAVRRNVCLVFGLDV